MYTVIRFTGGFEAREEVARIGLSMNSVRAGVFSGLRRRGDGFSCDLSSDKSWDAHVGVHRFFAEFDYFIKEALQIGAVVTVDVAIEPEDREASGSIFVSGCGPDLLATLASAGLRMEVSVY